MGSNNSYSNNAYGGGANRATNNDSAGGFRSGGNAYQSTTGPVSNYGGGLSGKSGPIKPSLLGSSRGDGNAGGEDMMTL